MADESPSTMSPKTIVRDYHHAWTSGDVDQAMTFVADDVFCRAPGVDLRGKDAYREFIAGFAPMLTGITDIADFADDNRVALFYYPETATTATAPAAEFFTVSGGLICESVLIFDRLSYGPPDQDEPHEIERD
ncbi:MAG: nuclear transport factor 2 family protein [Brevibacterium sp.]